MTTDTYKRVLHAGEQATCAPVLNALPLEDKLMLTLSTEILGNITILTMETTLFSRLPMTCNILLFS